jgi:glycosyltransferase involved in cell wall biosynthesis
MTTPRLSVCIPCYNAAPFLEECIKSALAQLSDDDEIILVNDGSTDDSAAIALRLLRPQDTFLQQVNKGTGPTRNRLLDAAKGTYLQFVDADDRLEAGAVISLLKHIPGYDVVYGDALNIDALGNYIRTEQQTPETSDWVINMLHYAPMTSTIMVRRDSIRCRWNEVFDCCDEYYFLLHMAVDGCRFKHVPIPVAATREHSSPTRRSVVAGQKRSLFITLLTITWSLRAAFFADKAGNKFREAYLAIVLTKWMAAWGRQPGQNQFAQAGEIFEYLGFSFSTLVQWSIRRRQLPKLSLSQVVKSFIKYNMVRFKKV